MQLQTALCLVVFTTLILEHGDIYIYIYIYIYILSVSHTLPYPKWKILGARLPSTLYVPLPLSKTRYLVLCVWYLFLHLAVGTYVRAADSDKWQSSRFAADSLHRHANAPETFLRSWQFVSHSRTYWHFMEPQSSLPRSPEPATCILTQINPVHGIRSYF